MVGESGTGKAGNKYYYYTCLTHRRTSNPCKLKSVDKKWLEDLVVNYTWTLLVNKGLVKSIAEKLCKLHDENTRKNTTIKSLEARRQKALKASQNLIAALEQGIVTEQTKIRMKELEAEIASLDFDIEQEKQRTYTSLSATKIESYLNSAVCGDIQEISVRKALVNTLVREVVLENNSVTITYNFTDGSYVKYKVTPEQIEEMKKQSLKKTASSVDLCSNILPSFPPAKVAFEHAAFLFLH